MSILYDTTADSLNVVFGFGDVICRISGGLIDKEDGVALSFCTYEGKVSVGEMNLDSSKISDPYINLIFPANKDGLKAIELMINQLEKVREEIELMPNGQMRD